ncbi:MAG: mechanosensitive ion channel domain-containing protein [Synechococcus sp.]
MEPLKNALTMQIELGKTLLCTAMKYPVTIKKTHLELVHIQTMNERQIQILLTVLLIVIFLIGRRMANRLISKRASNYSFSQARTNIIKNISSILWTLFLLLGLGIIWEITFQGLTIYFASFFTVVGIAFFASWSILSSITAATILFFSFPIRIGYRIRIQDGDNSIEGEIVNISLFNIQIQKDNAELVFYPNNLALQKAIVHLNRELLSEESNSIL